EHVPPTENPYLSGGNSAQVCDTTNEPEKNRSGLSHYYLPKKESALTLHVDPTDGMRAACCASAASGQAAAVPPSKVMKSCRFTRCPSHRASLPHRQIGGVLCVTAKSRGQCPSWVKTGRTRIEHLSSALPPIADITETSRHFGFVP